MFTSLQQPLLCHPMDGCLREVALSICSSIIRRSFFLPKQSQRSRSILQDGSRSLGLFRKVKIGIIAKFHRTDLVICSCSIGTKPPSYSRINTVYVLLPIFNSPVQKCRKSYCTNIGVGVGISNVLKFLC